MCGCFKRQRISAEIFEPLRALMDVEFLADDPGR